MAKTSTWPDYDSHYTDPRASGKPYYRVTLVTQMPCGHYVSASRNGESRYDAHALAYANLKNKTKGHARHKRKGS
jgi:hypothetical protein